MKNPIPHREEDLLKWQIKNALKLNNITNHPQITIQTMYTSGSDAFYNKNDMIWDLIQEPDACNFENLEFFETETMHNEYSIQNNFKISDYPEIFEDLFEHFWADLKPFDPDIYNSQFESKYLDVEYKDLTLDEQAIVDDWVSYLDFWKDIWNEGDMCEALFGIDDESIKSDIQESLAYWTIYFEPSTESVENALKAGLVPFKYDGEFYLALGGCGMDLSPKLDAYQALCTETIPKNSTLFSQRDYFESVVGKELTKEVIRKCTRTRPMVNITFEVLA